MENCGKILGKSEKLLIKNWRNSKVVKKIGEKKSTVMKKNRKIVKNQKKKIMKEFKFVKKIGKKEKLWKKIFFF